MRFADPAQYVIDDVSNGRFSVHRDVYRDEALFQAEIAHIFEGTWVYLCHVSQVRQPYDYFCTQIGRRSVIVSRDGDGALHCFYNTCRHRGASLCQSEAGNRRRHVCRYHGWAYDSAGRNVYIKHEDRGRYPGEFQDADHDLIKVPRFGEYAGFLFASVNPDVPSLEEHLDDGRVLLDLVAEQGPEGMEVVPGRSRYYFNANWKLQMDNGMDPYHLTSTHQTFMQIVQRRAQGESSNESVESPDFEQRFAMTAGAYSFRNGHSMIWNDQYKPEMQPLWGCIDEVRRKVGEIRARWMLRARNITIFPNLQFNDSTSLVLRSYLPLAVDRTEMQVYSFAPVGEAEQMRIRRVRQHEDFFNSSGMATPDDTAIYADCQQGFDAFPDDYLQGFTRGMEGLLEGPDDEARELGVNPVNSLYGDYLVQGEVAYHAHYRQWVHLLRAGQQRAGRASS